MRLDEFYNPEEDNYTRRKEDDTRKPVLTLRSINKLRKYRNVKKAEEKQQSDLASVMYAVPDEGAGGGGLL